jgi:hypothetical protein
MLTRWILFSTVAVAGTLLTGSCAPVSRTTRPIDKINHLIVIFQENWSFDGLYGVFPGANGIANAGATINQVDKEGRPYITLPAVIDNTKRPPAIDARVPPDLPVKPFDLSPYIPPDQKTGVPVHPFYIGRIPRSSTRMMKTAGDGTTSLHQLSIGGAPERAFQPSSSPRMPRGGSWITHDTTRHRSSSSSRHGGTWRLWARATPLPIILLTPLTFHRSPRENDDPRALASQPTCHQL